MNIVNNISSLKAIVKINYSEIQGFGKEVVQIAEEIKPELEKMGSDLRFHITRAYKLNPKMKDKELMTDMFIPQKRILISAKKLNVTPKEKLKNFFRINFSQTASTADFSKGGLIEAANRAEKYARQTKSENIFSFLKDLLLIPSPGCTGPR